MANVTYTVVKGDTLSQIAAKHNTTVSALVKLNHIPNPNYIVVGQVLIISSDSGIPEPKVNYSNRAVIDVFGLQAKSDRTVYATWTWDRGHVKNYEVKWVYYIEDSVGFINMTTSDIKQSLYDAPENATHVAFYVKPVSETYTVEGSKSEMSYWWADWSTVQVYYFQNNPPSKPDVPVVEIKDLNLTASLDNLDLNAKIVQFQVVKNDETVFSTGKSKIVTTHASYSCAVEPGNTYKVRCRAIRGDIKSDWSEYSANASTPPAAPSNITALKALTKTSIQIDWQKVTNASSYTIEYTTDKEYFDSSSSEVKSQTVNSTITHAEITGLEPGHEWFFRVNAANDDGSSAWTKIRSIVLGKAPSVPTTWSSTTTVIAGESLTLYWVHNSEDGSSQTYAQLELDIGGVITTETIKNTTDEDEKDKTSSYAVSTSGYTEGTVIKWRVKTKGILDDYSEWSVQREVNVYVHPTLALMVTNSKNESFEVLDSFPFHVRAIAGPNTQKPVGYHVTITANQTYETMDSIGNTQIVKDGDEVYSKYFDTSEELSIDIYPSDVNLDNNISYTLTCVVSMDSGLTGEASYDFTVGWTEKAYSLDAEIGFDETNLSTYINPYCADSNQRLVSGITLSVYRREFDGSFIELATGLNNLNRTYITDPHPSLDYARYRVIAVEDATGAVSFTDVPGYPVGVKSVIIQWDEEWSSFETSIDAPMEQPPWSGSLLKLPYNIDVSDSHDSDVSLVEYIGRKHPVSYYGTQLGVTSTWNVDIEKSDKETLYALRRLAIWMGDVYVREPSGSGYWARIKVSFSQKHCELTIPVTLDITRVSGGI